MILIELQYTQSPLETPLVAPSQSHICIFVSYQSHLDTKCVFRETINLILRSSWLNISPVQLVDLIHLIKVVFVCQKDVHFDHFLEA
jgi:hypothetical protein